ncbi:hypothetical protein ACXR6G_04115 [Ancylomarina sp. YFZ004]
MKNTTKILLLMLVLTLVFVEATSSDFSLYKSHCETWFPSDNFNTVPVKTSKKFDQNFILIHQIGVDDIDIIINDLESNALGSSKEDSCIQVSVDKKLDLSWTRYIPLIKMIGVDSDYNYKWSANACVGNDTISISDTGSFHLKGKMNIYGICSSKKAEEIIVENIYENARNKIKQEVNEKLRKL